MMQSRGIQKRQTAFLVLTFLKLITLSFSYNLQPNQQPTRRKLLENFQKGVLGSLVISSNVPFWLPSSPLIPNSYAAALPITTATTTSTISTTSTTIIASTSTTNPNPQIQTLLDAYTALTNLLQNWDKATIDCTYADVPRELLEQKNKAELLEKASTFALFDKSTSVVSCKKNNKIVRDYIGVTGKGPMVGIEKMLLKQGNGSIVREVMDVNPEKLEEYFDSCEEFSQALAKASSLSYMAGVADFDSVNTFAKGSDADVLNGDGNSNLDQTKRAIGDIQGSLGKIIGLVTSSTTTSMTASTASSDL